MSPELHNQPRKRFPPDDPREWLNRARSNLAQAEQGIEIPDVYLEDLCFNAQQAAEKALKAVLIEHELEFPYVHDLVKLMETLLQGGHDVPDKVREAARISQYAVAARYPGSLESLTRQDYEEALILATTVVRWAEDVIGSDSSEET